MGLNKKDILMMIQHQTGFNEEEIKEVLDLQWEIIQKELLDNEEIDPKEREVRIHPYGKFRIKVIKPKKRIIGGVERTVKKQYKIAFSAFKKGTKKF